MFILLFDSVYTVSTCHITLGGSWRECVLTRILASRISNVLHDGNFGYNTMTTTLVTALKARSISRRSFPFIIVTTHPHQNHLKPRQPWDAELDFAHYEV